MALLVAGPDQNSTSEECTSLWQPSIGFLWTTKIQYFTGWYWIHCLLITSSQQQPTMGGLRLFKLSNRRISTICSQKNQWALCTGALQKGFMRIGVPWEGFRSSNFHLLLAENVLQCSISSSGQNRQCLWRAWEVWWHSGLIGGTPGNRVLKTILLETQIILKCFFDMQICALICRYMLMRMCKPKNKYHVINCSFLITLSLE